MTQVSLFIPTDDLLRQIEADLEDGDRQELTSATGDPVLETLQFSRAISHECFVALIAGNPVAVFGCAIGDAEQGLMGHPWAVFTKGCRRYPREIMRVGRQFVDRWSEWYPLLTNFVDARNERAIRWLESLGFVMQETTTDFATDASPFIRFEKLNV